MPHLTSRTLARLVVFGGLLAGAPAASAQPAVGVIAGSAGDAITTLDTTVPGTFGTSRAITGVLSQERIVGIDYRWIPKAGGSGTPGLYGLGINSTTGATNLYRLDPATGAATPVGPGFSRAAGAFYGFDIDPAADVARVVSSGDDNVRIDLDTGALLGIGSALSPASRGIASAALDRVNVAPSPAAVTTAYVIDPIMDRLSTLGGIDGSPSPDSGGIVAIGSLGADVSPFSANFDVGYDGRALATLTVGGIPGLYRVDLATGAITLVAALNQALTAFAIVPGAVALSEPTSSVSERGQPQIGVTRTGAIDGPATVRYAVGGGTADPVTDFRPSSGTLTFAAGQATATIPVELADDEVREEDETIGVTLSQPSAGLQLGAPSSALITVVDDDGPAPKTLAAVAAQAAQEATAAAMVNVNQNATQIATAAAQEAVRGIDTVPPTISLSVKRKLRRATLLKALAVKVTTNERATLTASLSARTTKATAARVLATRAQASNGGYNLELASAALATGDGTRVLRLKPAAALFGRPTKRVLVRLTVTATDAAGNAASATQLIAVTR